MRTIINILYFIALSITVFGIFAITTAIEEDFDPFKAAMILIIGVLSMWLTYIYEKNFYL